MDKSQSEKLLELKTSLIKQVIQQEMERLNELPINNMTNPYNASYESNDLKEENEENKYD